ncbi:Os01g0115725 [Oryza sativa Japonica Group]|uniref:Os01g0115725 protein n=1 Tax=Oryza sativa subsp. japonica TaxID=39947 RepID=A0A0N7KC80_ORYSJ|nr:Os01g0115725 [Oryza sativa Japonica Group]
MIPLRKRASATGYVGVDDPKASVVVVDFIHMVCCIVNENCSIGITADQLVRFAAAPRWISCPTEWSRYTLKMAARERRTLVMPSFNMIQYKTHNHK